MGLRRRTIAGLALLGLAGGTSLACRDEAAPAGPAPADGGADGADAVAAIDAGVRIVPKGARVLGVAMATGDVAFANNAAEAFAAGARATNVSLAWDEIERELDGGAPEDGGDDAAVDASGGPKTQLFNANLHVAGLVLGDQKMAALLSVAAVDVGGPRVPAGLAGRPLDDAEVGARYDGLTDYVLRSTTDLTVSALLVGTDVDVGTLPLGADAARAASFATFVGRAAAHARSVKPGLKVGFTVTESALAADSSRFQAAWGASDFVGITYLAIDAAGRARDPAEVAARLDRVVASAPAGKPIFVHEAGFPSAAAAGADDARQAAFVAAVFSAWDRHADRIPLLVFREMNDASPETVARLAARHGRSDAPFLAALGSLGLRGQNGASKAAWNAVGRESRARGF